MWLHNVFKARTIIKLIALGTLAVLAFLICKPITQLQYNTIITQSVQAPFSCELGGL